MAASLKTTTTIDVSNWMTVSNNAAHLNRLRDGKVAGEFIQGDNRALAELVELHIYGTFDFVRHNEMNLRKEFLLF